VRKITRSDLWSLEEYAEKRPSYRQQVLAHKKNRRVALGELATVYFEDDITIRYQIQEMLRVEKVFEVEGIQDELDAYNPLIGDGSNWKATFMIEIDDPDERAKCLREFVGIEDRVWVQVDKFERSFAIADEDMERENEQKTAAVHFLRFELNAGMITSLKNGSLFQIGVDHPNYLIPGFSPAPEVRDSLIKDLETQ
jgi:hypothetical protein